MACAHLIPPVESRHELQGRRGVRTRLLHVWRHGQLQLWRGGQHVLGRHAGRLLLLRELQLRLQELLELELELRLLRLLLQELLELRDGRSAQGLSQLGLLHECCRCEEALVLHLCRLLSHHACDLSQLLLLTCQESLQLTELILCWLRLWLRWLLRLRLNCRGLLRRGWHALHFCRRPMAFRHSLRHSLRNQA